MKTREARMLFQRPQRQCCLDRIKRWWVSVCLTCGLMILMCLCCPTMVLAQVYGYVDENGVFHFTDNVGDIPKEKRPEADFYPGVERRQTNSQPEKGGMEQSAASSEEEAGTESFEDVEEEPTGTAEPTETTEITAIIDDETDEYLEETEKHEGDAVSRYDELIRIQTALHEEQVELEKERDALILEKKAAKTNGKVRVYNRKVSLLNERIRAYEEKNAAFQKEVDTYNVSINTAPEEESIP